MWVLSNLLSLNSNRSKSLSFNDYFLETDQEIHYFETNKIFILFNGYVLPRSSITSGGKGIIGCSEIYNLYQTFKKDFIQYVKGNFIIIIGDSKGFTVYSDRFAIRKFFMHVKNDEFIITDHLEEITKRIKLSPSTINMALYGITYHFVNGGTIFNDVEHNQPGEVIIFGKERIKKFHYWNPSDLLKIESQPVSIRMLAEEIKSFIQITASDTVSNISLSLTGGADTRNLLACFLSLGKKPHVYTYGNPDSRDCMRASTIADKLDLEHSIYDLQIDPSVFEENARRILSLSGGLASIHRVHRLMSVELESSIADIMYLGTLGGEFVRGVSEDDYIISPIVYENWNSSKIDIQSLSSYLLLKRIKKNNGIISDIKTVLESEPYMYGNSINRKINALSFITAHLHDAQDINLYNTVFSQVYTPFMDIDYLEMLFSSKYSFNNKENIKNKYIRKTQNPVFAAHFLKEVYPSLTYFTYSGEHMPSEVLYNKYYAALAKRIRMQLSRKYPSNFPLNSWMLQFVKNNLKICSDYPTIKDVFDIEKLISDLESENVKSTEAFWLKYTNPIMMRFLIDLYT